MATVKVDLGLALQRIEDEGGEQVACVRLAMEDAIDPVELVAFHGCIGDDKSYSINLEPLQARVLAAQLLAAASMADARGGSSPEDE